MIASSITSEMETKKLVFVIDTLQTGGAEKSTLEIATRLRNQFEVYVVTVYFFDHLNSLVIDYPHLKYIHLDIKGKYQFRQAYKKMRILFSQIQPSLVVATLYRAEITSRLVCLKMRIPNVGTFVNDTYSPYELESLNFIQKLKIGFFWILNFVTARFCIGFLANSNSIKNSNSKALFIKLQKIHVIPRGRDLNYFVPNSKGTNREEFVFVTVGRLLERKGHVELIEAFARIEKSFPNARLYIAGEGPFRMTLENKIAAYSLDGKVTLLGNVRDVNGLLQQADIFVFPSWYEGFSGALVEAMLAGVPIIASNIEMNKEAVRHRETAYLFEVRDVKAIENAMDFAISENAKMREFAVAAGIEAKKRFDIEKIAEEHAKFYNSITSKPTYV